MSFLWECIPPEVFEELRKYQERVHGLKLDIMREYRKPVTMSPDVEEEHISLTNKFMSQAPSRRRYDDGE